MTYRKYDKKTKLSVIMAAEMVGVTAAAEAAGIPVETAAYWVHDPKFAEFRSKTREEMHDEVRVVTHLALRRVAQTLDTMEPRDALFAMEKATSLYLLMGGEATSRTEARDLTKVYDDHELTTLRDFIDKLDGPAGTTGQPGEAAGTEAAIGPEVRQPSAESLL